MNRRSALLTLSAIALGAPFATAQEQAGDTVTRRLADVWAAWKATVLTPDGRVVDGPQQGASHSESQGYGLFLAARMGDAQAFQLIDDWTTTHLQVRGDNLLAWRWLADGVEQVPDHNNASDGDLFYAWGLILGAAAFNRPELTDRATAIARDLAAACIQPHPADPGRVIFTPAAHGFARDGGSIINLSYYMPLAMRQVALATGISVLAAAARDGDAIMRDLAQYGLMPDWIMVGPAGYSPDPQLSDRSGYDALRVPLFLIWSGQKDHPAVLRYAEAHERAGTAPGTAPIIFDRTRLTVQETSAHRGYLAVAALVACAPQDGHGAAMPPFAPDQPYYPLTLHLFAFLAQMEGAPTCVPI